MSAIKDFVRDRDDTLRSLDEVAFDGFARKWRVPPPAQWKPLAKLAAMHKARVQLAAFTPAEKSTSRTWLAANGFTEEVGTKRSCPECGLRSVGFSNCSTCGMAQ